MKYYKTEKTHVIGVMGAQKGAGATWLSLMTASYLSDIKNRKTCLLELSKNSDLAYLADNSSDAASSKRIKIEGIDIYCNAGKEEILSVRNKGYDICVLDLGCVQSNKEELLRCDTKIIAASVAPWLENCESLINQYKEEVESFDSWRLFINFSLPKIKKYLGKVPVVTGFVPTETNPLRLSEDSIRFFRNMNF